ncbi:hypothetical protein SETIT_1G096700v2 [Setaria italica]|uniref:Uncharacterized protein n=1 Tax=Setaria italica TaxID=4555 RepID=A0A368PIK1_SETIT|nr:hypothetical protein SETIT_1G096700v2 [Setaria italica]
MVRPTEDPHGGNGLPPRRLPGKAHFGVKQAVAQQSRWRAPPSCRERLPGPWLPSAVGWAHTAAPGRGKGFPGRAPGTEFNAPRPRMVGPDSEKQGLLE